MTEDAAKPVCARCGSDKLMRDLKVLVQTGRGPGSVHVLLGCLAPSALVFKQARFAQPCATICGACGHTELTVDNPDAVYRAWQAVQAKVRKFPSRS